ncbi:hypothetical protein [Mucilaginibacter gynuensis]|uniref:hypothetical protein n=1 Tax=Mucilaginibacter gynuensis TaxID=1302236 RepID=UPI0031E55B33
MENEKKYTTGITWSKKWFNGPERWLAVIWAIVLAGTIIRCPLALGFVPASS